MAAEENTKKCAISGILLVALLALAAGAAYYYFCGPETMFVLPDDDFFDYIEEHVGSTNGENRVNNVKSFPRSEHKKIDSVHHNPVECHFEREQLKASQDVLENPKLLKHCASEQSHSHEESDFDTELTIYLTLQVLPIDSEGEFKSIPNDLSEISKTNNQNIIFKVSSTESVDDLQSKNSVILITLPHSEIDSYIIGKLLQGQNIKEYNNGEENVEREKMRIRHPLKWNTRNIRATHSNNTNETLNVSGELNERSLKDIEMKNVPKKLDDLSSNISETQVNTQKTKPKNTHSNDTNETLNVRDESNELSLKDIEMKNVPKILDGLSSNISETQVSTQKTKPKITHSNNTNETLNVRDEPNELSLKDIEIKKVSQILDELLPNVSETQGSTQKPKPNHQRRNLSHINRRRCRQRRRRLENSLKMDVIVAVDNTLLNTNRSLNWSSERFNLRWSSVRKCLKHVVNDWTLEFMYNTTVFRAKTNYANTLRYCLSLERNRYEKLIAKFASVEGCISKKAKENQKAHISESEMEGAKNETLGLNRKSRNVMKRKHNRRRKRHVKKVRAHTLYDNLQATTKIYDLKTAKNEASTSILESKEVVSMAQINGMNSKNFGTEAFQNMYGTHRSEIDEETNPMILGSSSNKLNALSNIAMMTEMHKILRGYTDANISLNLQNDTESVDKKDKKNNLSLILNTVPMEQVLKVINIGDEDSQTLKKFLQIISQNILSEDTLNMKQYLNIFLIKYIPKLLSLNYTDKIREEILNNYSMREKSKSEYSISRRRENKNHLQTFDTKPPIHSMHETTVVEKGSTEETKAETVNETSRFPLGTLSEGKGSLHEQHDIRFRNDPRVIVKKSNEEEESKEAYRAILTRYIGRILQRLPVAEIIRNTDETSERPNSKMEDIKTYVQNVLVNVPIEELSRNIYKAGHNISTSPGDRDALLNYVQSMIEKPINDKLNHTPTDDTKTIPFDQKVMWKYIHGVARLISDGVANAEKSTQDIELPSLFALNTSLESLIPDIRYLIELEKENRRMNQSESSMNEKTQSSITDRKRQIRKSSAREKGNYPWILPEPEWKYHFFGLHKTSKNKDVPYVTDSGIVQKKKKTADSRNMVEVPDVSHGRVKRDIRTNTFTESTVQNILIQSEQLKSTENTVSSMIADTDTDEYNDFIKKLKDGTLFDFNEEKNYRAYYLKRQALSSNKDTVAQENVPENQFYQLKRKKLTEAARDFLRELNIKLNKLKHKTLERLERSHRNINKTNESFVANASHKDSRKIFEFREIRQDDDIKRPSENSLSSTLEQTDNFHNKLKILERSSDQRMPSLQTDEPTIKLEVVHNREKHKIPQDPSQTNSTKKDKQYVVSGEMRGVVLSEYARAPPTMDVSCSRKEEATSSAIDADDAAVAVALLSLGLFTTAVFLLKVTRAWGGARRLVSLWNLSPRSDSGDEIISDGHMVDIETGQQRSSGPAARSKKSDPLVLEKVFFIEGGAGGEQRSSPTKEHVPRAPTQPMTSSPPSKDPPPYEQHHRSPRPASRVPGIPAHFNAQPLGALPPSPMSELPMTWAT